MRFAIIGGDARAAVLGRLLLQDGHRVQSFALEKATGERPPAADSLQAAVYGVDCVLLPVPVGREGLLNTPLSEERLETAQVLEALWPGQWIFGGGLREEELRLAERCGLRCTDLLRRPDLAVGNAALTAEGALGLLIRESPKALWGGRVLICGWGRIGRMLALRLDALGAEVSVAARRGEDRAMIRVLGLQALDYPEIEEQEEGWDYVVNTVPARVLGSPALCSLREDTLLLELASAPGGFDRSLAEHLGLKVLAAPGLPGKSAPWAAARLMKRCIETAMEERED